MLFLLAESPSLIRMFLVSGKAPVLYSMGLFRIDAEPALSVRFVFAVISVEIFDVRIAFERENVGRDAVKEPTVMTYYDGAARKVFESFFECTHRVDIKVVRRFVKKQDVGARSQHFRQVHAVAFAAGKLADTLLLVAAGKIKPRN